MPSRNVKARPLSWRISQDRRVNELDDSWAMLAYTWMIPSADNMGRMEGDPDLLASMVFPRKRDIVTPERMTAILASLHKAGLVYWYEVQGERYVQFPPESWERHQRLIGNMVAESDFPEPNADEYRLWWESARVLTGSNELIPVVNEGKGREGKRREEDMVSPQKVLAIWVEVCGDVLPRPSKLTPARKKHVETRLKAEPGRDEAWWRNYFSRIRASPGVCGENDRGWKADFDWAVDSEDKVARVLEGKYDSWGHKPTVPQPARAQTAQIPPLVRDEDIDPEYIGAGDYAAFAGGADDEVPF